MTPTAERDEARDIRERALRLPLNVREELVLDLINSFDTPQADSEELKRAEREEIARRIEAVRNGSMKGYTLDETMEYLQRVVDEGSRS